MAVNIIILNTENKFSCFQYYASANENKYSPNKNIRGVNANIINIFEIHLFFSLNPKIKLKIEKMIAISRNLSDTLIISLEGDTNNTKINET